ncbi:MAG: hypothetical protein ACXVCP_19015, partial [Bdellovibrio sp.]
MNRLMKRIGVSAIAVFSVSAANAGTVLKLNAGNIDTNKIFSNYAASWGKDTEASDYIVQFKKAV